MPLLWRHCGDCTARPKLKNLLQSVAHLLRTFFSPLVWINHSLVTASTLPFPSHTEEKHKKATAEYAKNMSERAAGRTGRNVLGLVGTRKVTEGVGRRAAAAAVMEVAVLGWLNFISQGVVADSRGAGPTMTLLHSYYSPIARTPMHLHMHAHTKLIPDAATSPGSLQFLNLSIWSAVRLGSYYRNLPRFERVF